MDEATYRGRLHEAARQEFKGFWSAYRFWITFVTVFLMPFGIQVVRFGWRSIVTLDETMTSAALGLIISVIGTYLIAMWKGAKSLDGRLRREIKEQDSTIAGRDSQIRQKEQAIEALIAKPQRTPGQEHHYETASAALKKIRAGCRDGSSTSYDSRQPNIQ